MSTLTSFLEQALMSTIFDIQRHLQAGFQPVTCIHSLHELITQEGGTVRDNICLEQSTDPYVSPHGANPKTLLNSSEQTSDLNHKSQNKAISHQKQFFLTIGRQEKKSQGHCHCPPSLQ